eukprot:3703185-Amphidinium_carterae.1
MPCSSEMTLATKASLQVSGGRHHVRPQDISIQADCRDLPELGTNLVAALTSLDVHQLTHGCGD